MLTAFTYPPQTSASAAAPLYQVKADTTQSRFLFLKLLSGMILCQLLAACGGSENGDAGAKAANANGASELSTTGLPLEMPMMRNAEILNPIKTRSDGKIQETIFKVKASPAEVVEFYKRQMLDRGFTIGEEYSDDVGLSSWGENDEYLFSMKGSTNKRDTPEAQRLSDGETRVLTIGRFKNKE